MIPEIHVPFTDDQVNQLNRFQRSRFMHPFTCGRRDSHPGNEGVLIAAHNGWRCPVQGCAYWQGWAHGFMADQAYLDGMQSYLQRMFSLVSPADATLET